jgi:hypothetical protein
MGMVSLEKSKQAVDLSHSSNEWRGKNLIPGVRYYLSRQWQQGHVLAWSLAARLATKGHSTEGLQVGSAEKSYSGAGLKGKEMAHWASADSDHWRNIPIRGSLGTASSASSLWGRGWDHLVVYFKRPVLIQVGVQYVVCGVIRGF